MTENSNIIKDIISSDGGGGNNSENAVNVITELTVKQTILDGEGDAVLDSPVYGYEENGYYFVICNASFQIFDIRDPNNIKALGFILDGEGGAQLNGATHITKAPYDNLVYVSCQDDNLIQRIDVSDLNVPVVYDTLDNFPLVQQVEFVGKYMHVLTYNNGYSIWDLSNRDNPFRTFLIQDGGGSPPYLEQSNHFVYADGHSYCLSNVYQSIQGLDVTDPYDVKISGEITAASSDASLNDPNYITEREHILFVTSPDTDAIEFFDCKSPANLLYLTEFKAGSGIMNNPSHILVMRDNIIICSEASSSVVSANIENIYSAYVESSIEDGYNGAELGGVIFSLSYNGYLLCLAKQGNALQSLGIPRSKIPSLSVGDLLVDNLEITNSAFANKILQANALQIGSGGINSLGDVHTTTNVTGQSFLVSRTGDTYTLILDDAYKTLHYNNSSDVIFTIPNDSAADLKIGTKIEVIQAGNGKIYFTPDSGVSLNSKKGYRISQGLGSAISLLKISDNEWVLSGDIDGGGIYLNSTKAWYDAADYETIITRKDGEKEFVKSWYDKSSEEGTLMQTNTNFQPEYLKNLKNGLSGIQFDGDGPLESLQDISFNPANTSFTLFLVTSPRASGSRFDLISQADGSGIGSDWMVRGTGDNFLSTLGGSTTDGAVPQSYIILTIKSDTNTISMYKNGIFNISNTINIVSNNGLLIVGTSKNKTSNPYFGNIFEILLYQKAFNDDEINAVTYYLDNKWN